jgi:hypothetical protein
VCVTLLVSAYRLLNNVVNSADYIAPYNWILVNDGLKRMRKEAVVAQSQIQFQSA